MNEKKLVQNFKSYINVSAVNNEDKNGSVQEVKPKLLNGELVVGAAHNVVLLTPLSEMDHGRFGSLFVTNYKVSFVPLDSIQADEGRQRSSLLGWWDVPLSGVGALWVTDGAGGRRRRLQPGQGAPASPKGLQIVAKNMKVLTFSFANSPLGKGRQVALALLHHAFPKRHDLLFAFECREPYYATLPNDMNMFTRPGDWKRELERCGCPHWRITCINGTSDAFMLCAGETLIVPSSVLDYNLMESARHFRSGSVPIWTWGRPSGAALLRSGELLPTAQAATAESVLLEQIRRSHPKLTPPQVLYLCGAPLAPGKPPPLAPGRPSLARVSMSMSMSAPGRTPAAIAPAPAPGPLPSLAALHSSYKKLVELCTPTTLNEFWMQDSSYYSAVESSRWLRHVSNSLAFAAQAAQNLDNNITTVLQEGDGVDYCAVVSSLTQLLVDPQSRTVSGFQSLVQKEWLALGHPFCDRLGLPRPGSPLDPSKETPSQLAPVFLLFLDCTWQLLQQFPSHFQFTETYLTTLWDCTHNHLFDTFIFNCPRDRELAVAKDFIQRPVWDWGEQFSEQDKALFYNPLYIGVKTTNTPQQRLSVISMSPKSTADASLPRLPVVPWVWAMELWSQCYERWLGPLDAPGAGPVQLPLIHYRLVHQIQRLNERVNSLSILSRHTPEDPEPEQERVEVSRFYPFSLTRAGDVRSLGLDSMQVSIMDASQLLDSQSLLNAPD